MAKIDIGKLSLVVISELQQFEKVTNEVVEDAVKLTAKETAQMLREDSPRLTGDYKKSWSYKRDPNLKGKCRYDMVVYSKDPEYRLTHLLEKGFQHRTGGRVSPRKHIAQAEAYAKMMLEERIRNNI